MLRNYQLLKMTPAWWSWFWTQSSFVRVPGNPCLEGVDSVSHKSEWIQTERPTKWSRRLISRFRPDVKAAAFLFIGEL
jgi:hypothetical protein